MRVRFDQNVRGEDGRVKYHAGFDYSEIPDKDAKAFVEQGVAREIRVPTPPESAAAGVSTGHRATRKNAKTEPPADPPQAEPKDKDAA